MKESVPTHLEYIITMALSVFREVKCGADMGRSACFTDMHDSFPDERWHSAELGFKNAGVQPRLREVNSC